MVLGFNHNLIYKGETFHVQTEDSGISNPHIITLLYRGGVIISSRKTSYADILKMENLEEVVEELMKEQHKDMMRRLKSGEYDEKAFAIKAQLIENYEIPSPEPEKNIVADVFGVSKSQNNSSSSDLSLLFQMPAAASVAPASKAPAASNQNADKTAKPAVNLDDAILSFFGGTEK